MRKIDEGAAIFTLSFEGSAEGQQFCDRYSSR
jgi:hypothetical protein